MRRNMEAFALEYKGCLAEKNLLGRMTSRLTDAARMCAAERDAMTMRVRVERPDLVATIEIAYANGERIKNAMQVGNRWPQYDLGKYLDILKAVPAEARSPEIEECLGHWQRFDDAHKELERLYPAPECFYWNGARLVGPNLYEFGIASDW